MDNFTTGMNAEYIKYMEPASHIWIPHYNGDGCTNNTVVRQGEGYEVRFSSETNYTFYGMPGAMIMYDDDPGFSGFDYTGGERNLTIEIQTNGDVNLTWQEPASMGVDDWYEVYYSNTRDGFFGTFDVDYFLVDPIINYGANTTT
ncbi:MAG: hypothetical protein JSW28_00655, partial [Thermoplasmata archaeon]